MAQSKEPPEGDRRALVRALRRRGAETCRSELDATLDAVEARGEFTPEQREVLAAFAERLSHRVLAPPRTALVEGEADPETAADLFDLR